MSRRRRIAMIAAGSVAGLGLILFVAAIIVVQTGWFRNTVRAKIVSAVEDATGGRVEVGSFSFDWTHLRAVVRDFVVHGAEPSTVAPLFRARLLEVDLKLTSPFRSFVDIAYLGVDAPQANVIVDAGGHSNIPAPKIKQPASNKSGLATVVDLAVGSFRLTNGRLDFANRQTHFSASGQSLRAQLTYSLLKPGYSGRISLSPLLLQTSQSAPVAVNVDLPVALETDSIRVTNAKLTTPASEVRFSGAMSHLSAPQTSAQVTARIALEEVQRLGGPAITLATGPGLPRFLTAEVAGSMDDHRIQISAARLTLGRSQVEASGTLKNGSNPAGLQFNAALALGQLGRLLRVAAQPEGSVQLNGTAKMSGASDYRVEAKLEARGLAFRQGATRLSGIDLVSSISADPRLLQLTGLRLSALGGTLAGNAELANMERFRANLDLRALDIQTVAHLLLPQRFAWDGVISGAIKAEGDIHAPRDWAAQTQLSIAPGHRGIPISGRIQANYSGRAGNIDLGRSYIALPSSRLDLSGSLGQRIQVRLVSHNLNDFLAGPKPAPVMLQKGGSATLTAAVTGQLSAPHIAGHLAAANFAVEGRAFTSFAADLDGSKSRAAVSNASLVRGPLRAQFSASVGLRGWKPESSEPLAVSLSIQTADARDVLALAGQADAHLTGTLNAAAQIDGTLGSPRGNASLDIANGTVYQEHFDRIEARVALTDREIALPVLRVAAGTATLDANASYRHPLNDLRRGAVRLHLASDPIALQQFRVLQQSRPGLAGTMQILADAAAQVQPGVNGEEFELTSVNGNASAHNLQMDGKNLGDFTATAQTTGTQVTYNINSNFAGSSIRVNGQSALNGNHETTATATIGKLPIDRVLALAGRRDLPLAGLLDAHAEVSGTLADPHANATLSVTNGAAYQQKFDRLAAQATYSDRLVDLPSLTVAQGANRIEASGSFAHPPGDRQSGLARFHLATNQLQLSQLPAVQQRKPGLAGTLELSAEGAATLRRNATPLFSSLNASVAAKGLSVNRQPLGDLTATARTSGNQLNFDLNSDFAKSQIKGNGRLQLAGDYPLTAQVTFGNVSYSGIAPWVDTAVRPGVDALAAGQIDIQGPAATPEAMQGTLRISTLDIHSVKAARSATQRTISLRNSGPIVVSLEHSIVRIQSARLQGSDADLSLSGTASLTDQRSLDLRADGNVNLAILQAFDSTIFSSGHVALNATVRGNASKPQVDGRLQLRDAAFNMMDVPNGLSNANGAIVFDGSRARIENLSGETGGGTVTMTGFVAYGGPEMSFRVQVAGRHFRVDYPAGVSTEANANITLAGTTSRSLVTGTLTVLNVALFSHTDVGSILSQAAAPPTDSSANTGLLAGMRLDVRVDTSPNVQFETALAENLQAEGHLTLRGTPANPGMLGRINVTEGELLFFGSKYTIDQGSVGFYNPQKIEPIVNMDLETEAQGVTVSLKVSGPIDQLKLTYHSDPPLQFSDLVALLATGKQPTTDPVLAATQPAAPQQSVTQIGASAALGQAVASPVSGRLQRLFGVTQLKIDPAIVGATNTPQARLTLEQQITRQIDFIYIQDVTQSNSEVIRIEWNINPTWTAVAERDIYGEFGVDLFYKKRFK